MTSTSTAHPSAQSALPVLAALIILVLAFALRVHQLDSQELRGDEAFGYFFSQRSYPDIVAATIALNEPHPVGSYFVQKAWLGLVGDSEFALRFSSVWWGVLAAALLYRLGRRLGIGGWPALAAMLLLTISPYMIWHSQDARMYAMSLALTIATVLLAVEAIQRQRWPWAAAYIGAAWLALHTHYYAIFVLLALNLFVITRALFVARTRPMLQPWLLWQVIVAALYLPWFARTGVILSAYGGNGDSPDLMHAVQRALSVFAVGESTPPAQQLWWGLIAAALLIMGIFRLAAGSRDDRRTLWLLAFYLLVPLLAIWWSAQERPIFNERYLVAAAPPFYLLIGAAFHAIPVRRPARLALDASAGVLFAILVAGMLFSLNQYFTNPAFSKTRGWRELATAVTRLAAGVPADRVRVAQNYPDPTLWYYYRGPVDHVVLPPSAHNQEGAISAVDALAQLGVQRVIMPLQPAANWDDTSLAAAALSERFDRVVQAQVGVWPVQVYAQPASAFTPLNAVFANGVTLRGAVLAPDRLAPSGLLAVHLDWRGDPGQLTGTEKVFVQVLDSAGQLVAQDDRPLTLTTANTPGTGAASYGILLPQELASGPYRLIAGLYDPGQEGAPRVSTTDGADHVEIAYLTP